MLIDKYNRIIIDKLPANIATEIKQIADDTENFTDDELVEIYKDNFNDLFKIIESKHPEALKAKKKLVKKASEKKKIVKKAEPKKKLVKKAGLYNPKVKETQDESGIKKSKFKYNADRLSVDDARFLMDASEEDDAAILFDDESRPTSVYFDINEFSPKNQEKIVKEIIGSMALDRIIKHESKKKIVKKAEPKFKVGEEVFTYWDKKGLNASKEKTDQCIIYKQGEVKKVTHNEATGVYTYNVKYAKGFYLADESVLNKANYISNAAQYIDLSMLVGKQIEVYEEGVKEAKIKKITLAKVDDPKFSTRGVYINADKTQHEFPLSKLEAFLEGKEITPKHDGDKVVIILKNASEIDCETAIAEIKAIHAKREAAAAKRAEAPKKKVTTAAREKQIKTIASVFKTKDFKADKKQAEGFAKDLVAVYSKYGLKSMADQLEKDIQELIDTKYK